MSFYKQVVSRNSVVGGEWNKEKIERKDREEKEEEENNKERSRSTNSEKIILSLV